MHDAFGIGEYNPSVALSPTGQFVVSYDTDNGIQVTEMRSNDTPLTTLGTGDGFYSAVSIDGLGRIVVTYTRYNPFTGHYDIFSRRDVLS